ncbi:MAG TPA: serine hydrolase [Clostridia bacterium]|nr:serine hydrolase [Clostridia bacterium]
MAEEKTSDRKNFLLTLVAKRREYELMGKTKKPKFWQDFNTSKEPDEKKRARVILLSLFGLSLSLVFLATLYRQLPQWWRKINAPATVVSQQFISPTATPMPELEKEKEAVKKLIEPLRGKYGIYYQDLEKNDYFEINGQEEFVAASLIKLPVMLTLYREAERGRVDLDSVYQLQEEDKRGGAGSLQYKPSGYEITYRQMAQLMGKQSDNTAFHVISQLLGEEKVQTTIDGLGMKQTSFTDNTTSPKDMGIFFERLYRGRLVTEKNKEEILSYLTKTIWEERIPAGLPEDTKVAHKIGTETKVVSDAGIVFAERPFILVILSQEVNEIEAEKALPEISKMVYEMNEQ